MNISLAPNGAHGILLGRPKAMLTLTAQYVAIAAGMLTPSYAPANDFVAVDLLTNPDRVVQFDSLHPGSLMPDSPTLLSGNYTRGIDLDSTTSGYLIHTAGLFGTPTGLYRFQNGVTTLVAALPILTENDCGLTLTPDHTALYLSLGEPRTDDTLFRCSVAGQFVQVAPIRRADGVVTDVIGLTISDAGVMYGLDTADDSLLRIDATTGAAMKIGPLGVAVGGEGELDFDGVTGDLIMAAGQITSRVYRVNTTTAASTLLGDLPFITSAIAFAGTPVVQCPTDLDNGGGAGIRDGAVTIDDLLYYLVKFEQGTAAADLDNGTSTGTPDGAVTIDDLLYFLVGFEQGC